MTAINDLLQIKMQDTNFKSTYESIRPEYELARVFIKARIDAGMTQQQVAEKMSTTQSVVARLESGKRLPSMQTIVKFAQATGHRPQLQFV